MRVLLVLCFVLLGACATEKLASAPPTGVDFSGRWILNVADSDDPQRELLRELGGNSRERGGQGDPSDGRGGGQREGGPPGGGFQGPVMPNFGLLSDGLRWPGKELVIKQVAGVVTFTSGGITQIYQPSDGPRGKPPHFGADPHRDRVMRGRGDGPPPICGWDDKTLVVRSTDMDEDHPPLVQRYSLTQEGSRLVETVATVGRPAGGATRVWDRAGPDNTKKP